MDVIQPYRVRDKNLIAGIQESVHGCESCLTNTYCYKNFRCFIICTMVLVLPFCNGFSQFRDTIVGCVKYMSCCKALICCFFDLLRCIKIRTSDLQVNDLLSCLLHFVCFFHYCTDTGKRKAFHSFRCLVLHIHFLLNPFIFLRMSRCFLLHLVFKRIADVSTIRLNGIIVVILSQFNNLYV